MKSPDYYVNIAGVNLHRVESVEDESGREITEYDGVGSGKFNVPDSRSPKTWEISCQLVQNGKELTGQNTWSASEIFKEFDSLLNSTDASRMVITNKTYPAANVSAMVWLKKFNKKEAYSGVYDVTISLEEYKPVGIKTTNIPYVARPGKLPATPKTITITSAKTIAKATKKYTGTAASIPTKATNYTEKFLELKDKQTGLTVTNPNTVPKNASLLAGSYVVSSQSATKSSGAGYTTLYSSGQKSEAQKWLESAGTAISNWFTGWQNSGAANKISSLG